VTPERAPAVVDRSRLPPLRAVPTFSFPVITKSTLANGLGVWTAHHPQVPMVGLVLLVQIGSANDPAGREGLAAITADMLDEGTGSRSAIDVHQDIARIGAQFDTDIGSDAMVISLTSLSRFTGRGLELLADVVTRPALRDADFLRVRQLRLNRLIQLRDMPGVIADRAFARLLYGDSPYGHTPLGNERSLSAMTVEDIRSFHRSSILPGAATLIAVGDCEHEAVRAAAEATFGDWSGKAGLEPSAMSSTSRPARLNIVPRSGAPQSELRIGHVAAPRSTPDYHALLAANMVLGGQFVSRINLNLRGDKGITYGARTAFEFRKRPGPFALHVSVDTAATALAIRESISEIAAIRSDRPVSAEELAVGVAALTRGYVRNFETLDQIARAVAQIALFDLPDDYYSRFVPRIEAVTPEEVTQVVARHLDPDRLTTVIVGDLDQVSQNLGPLDLGQPVVLTADSI
jgi:zinc protease